MCAKHTELKALIDKRVEDGKMVAIGNNCVGML